MFFIFALFTIGNATTHRMIDKAVRIDFPVAAPEIFNNKDIRIAITGAMPYLHMYLPFANKNMTQKNGFTSINAVLVCGSRRPDIKATPKSTSILVPKSDFIFIFILDILEVFVLIAVVSP